MLTPPCKSMFDSSENQQFNSNNVLAGHIGMGFVPFRDACFKLAGTEFHTRWQRVEAVPRPSVIADSTAEPSEGSGATVLLMVQRRETGNATERLLGKAVHPQACCS